MSNHSGSYMLNDVLNACVEAGMFDVLSSDKQVAFLQKVHKIGSYYDCNWGEIICTELAHHFGICICCAEPAPATSLDKEGYCGQCF